MRLIDADLLIQKYLNKKNQLAGNKNAEILADILVETISTAPTAEIVPYYQELGLVDTYSNGMVALRKESFEEYSKIVEEYLSTNQFSAEDYLNTLDKIQKDKKVYKKLFPKGITNAEKIKAVKEWKEKSENSLNNKI